MKKLFLLLSAVFALSTTTFAQRIAVVDFNAGVGISQQDVDGIAAIFNTYFSPGGYTLVERTTIDRVIDEQQFQRGKITEQQMVRLGQILNVSKIVIGDVNVVAGEYNIDVRVVNVESGTIAAKDGATWMQGSTYRTLMSELATRLANQIAINPRASQSVSTETSATRNKVEVIYGYLKVFPNELGEFPSEPKTVIEQINKQAMHDYDTWRLPTTEELALLKANGLVGSGKYMRKGYSEGGIVVLVTDATETYSAKQQARMAEEKRLAEKKAKEEAEKRRIAEKEKLYAADIKAGKGMNGVYRVGYYYNRDGVEGVVFDVYNDGRNGSIVSMKQWYDDRDAADGLCRSLGEGWKLPSAYQLYGHLYPKLFYVNSTLGEYGGHRISGGEYWSSTTKEEEFWTGSVHYYNMVVNMNNGSEFRESTSHTNKYRSIRAVHNF